MRTAKEILTWRKKNPGKVLDLNGAGLYGADLCGANLCGADLRGADLDGANLRVTNLRGADLSRADLSRADLYGTNFSGADLRGANLREANLGRADFRGANGVAQLDMVDPRGYSPIAQEVDGNTMIKSGCRYFTVDEALAHWGDEYQGDREIGDRYLRAIRQYVAEREAIE